MKLLNIGFGNMVSAERLIAVVSPDSAPIKRLIQESRERGMLIDATYGRKTASVFIMDSDHVVLLPTPDGPEMMNVFPLYMIFYASSSMASVSTPSLAISLSAAMAESTTWSLSMMNTDAVLRP